MSLDRYEMILIEQGLEKLEQEYCYSDDPEEKEKCDDVLLLLAKVKQVIDELK